MGGGGGSYGRARTHARTQTPSCTITLFEDRDARSLSRGTVRRKAAVCLGGVGVRQRRGEGGGRSVYVCQGWRRGVGVGEAGVGGR